MPYTEKGHGYQKTDTSFKAIGDPTKRFTAKQIVLHYLSSIADYDSPNNSASSTEIADRCFMNILTVRPRLTELCNEGWIIDSNIRRLNKWNKQEVCWRINNESVS